MQIKKAILSFLSISLLLLLTWSILLFDQSILEENSNLNLNHIPENASFAIRIDGRELIEKTFFSVFLESKDAAFLKLLQKEFSKSTTSNENLKNYGIDYLSDIILFQTTFEKEKINGLLVNVSNPLFFKKNTINPSIVSFYKDGVGVILMLPESDKPFLKSKLALLAKKIVVKSCKPDLSQSISNHGPGIFFESYSNSVFSDRKSIFSKTKMLFELQKNELLIKGEIELKKKNKEEPVVSTILQPHGLHISSSIVPDELIDTLNTLLKPYSISLPQVKSISLNFHGTKVINHSTGFFIVPQIDLFITCENSIDIAKFIKNEQLCFDLDYKLGVNSIRFQDETLYYKQITENSFYIGIHPEPIFNKNDPQNLLSISGSLHPLTTIQGGGLMTAFLEMLPIYKASKTLAEHTESIHLDLRKKSKGNVFLSGKVQFNKKYSPMNELVKFALVGQLSQ